MFVSVLLAHVLDIVVPVTTGLPAGSVYVPDPLRLIIISLFLTHLPYCLANN